MLLYVLLDWSTDIILWLVKNLGLVSYYSVCYILGYSTENGETEQTQQLKELIEQKKDIEEIKKLLEEIKNKKNE